MNEPLIITLYRRRVEQLAARRAHNPKVAGSSPAPAIYSYPGKGAWDCEKRSREMSGWCKLTRSSWGLARSPGEDACQWLCCSKSCWNIRYAECRVEMEDLLANLSFLRAWIHKPAFPGLLYSGSCNLRRGLFVYRKVLGIVDPAGGVQLPYRPYVVN